jgi:D-alanyl-D-alanine carboxypeptidase
MYFRPVLIIMFFVLLQAFGNTGTKGNSGISSIAATRKVEIEKKYLLGQYNYKTEKNFVKVDAKYGNKEGMYLMEEVYNSFLKMREAAAKEGITLIIVSATRNFGEQKTIWEAKWNGNKLVNGENLALTVKDPVERARIILNYSSMPGTSRHHWGTDIDINSIENNYFAAENGKKVYAWLQKNSATYGFCQPYTEKTQLRPNGYNEEKWHWSYISIANVYLTEYIKIISNSDISGFSGSETATSLNIINNYVLGLNKNCIN